MSGADRPIWWGCEWDHITGLSGPERTSTDTLQSIQYVVLILGQACVFFIRLMVARLRQPIPIDQAVLIHYLKRAIDTLEANDLSETEICGWIAQLSKDLVRTTGLSLDVGDSRADTE